MNIHLFVSAVDIYVLFNYLSKSIYLLKIYLKIMKSDNRMTRNHLLSSLNNNYNNTCDTNKTKK